MQSYRYILRYYIDNGFDTEARIEELATFCERSRTEEVMLFLTPEELSPGHPSDAEIDVHIALAQRIARRLQSVGTELSLNPWTTLYQVPRGRALRKGQHFRLMVGESGATSPIVACPLCEEWQEWICSRFARLAREVQPVAIWVEDDWRLHNHGGELGWGGCFCAEHLRLFSEAVGTRVTREELLMALLRPGTPHPWRDAWFALSRETILQPLQKLSAAITAANPATATALMCSMPDQHSAEGRDWLRIKQAISTADKRFLLRPHMPPYTQVRALRSTPAILRQTLACLPAAADSEGVENHIYPELENSPRSGIFSKSGRYTIWQLVEAALFGSRGITLNHYDMLGNGIALDTAFGEHLRAAKAKLNALRALNIDDANAEGAQMLFSPQIASHIRLQQVPRLAAGAQGALSMSLQDPSQQAGIGGDVASLQQLVHNSIYWSETCAILGISQRLSTSVQPEKGPVFVCGQTLRAFSDAQIEQLLGGTLVLDAESVLVLLERGFGEYIGVAEARWNELEANPYGYESICEPDASVYTLANPRMSAQRCANRILAMEPVPQTRIRSTIHSPLYAVICPGTIDFENSYGGRVISFCYPLGSAQFYMGYFNVFRARFLQRLLTETGRQWPWAMAENGLRCQRMRVDEGTLFAILNPTDDLHEQVSFHVSRDGARNAVGSESWRYLKDDGQWQQITPRAEQEEYGIRYTFAVSLAALDSAIFLRDGV